MKKIFLVFLFVLVLCGQVWGDTDTLRPVAYRTYDVWLDWPAAGDAYEKIDEVTPDGDTTYLYLGGTLKRYWAYEADSFVIANPDSVRMTMRARTGDIISGTPETIFGRITSGAWCTSDDGTDTIEITSTYTDYSITWTTNPCGGAAWNTTALNHTSAAWAFKRQEVGDGWYHIIFKIDFPDSTCTLWINNTKRAAGTLPTGALSFLGDSVRVMLHSSNSKWGTDYGEKTDKYDDFVWKYDVSGTVALEDNFNDNSLDTDKWVKRVECYDGNCCAQSDWTESGGTGNSNSCDSTGSKAAGAGIYTKNQYTTDSTYILDVDFWTNWDYDRQTSNQGMDGIWLMPGDTTGTNFWDPYYGSPTVGIFIRISSVCGNDNDGVGIYFDNDLGWECGWDNTIEQTTFDVIDTGLVEIENRVTQSFITVFYTEEEPPTGQVIPIY